MTARVKSRDCNDTEYTAICMYLQFNIIFGFKRRSCWIASAPHTAPSLRLLGPRSGPSKGRNSAHAVDQAEQGGDFCLPRTGLFPQDRLAFRVRVPSDSPPENGF